MGRVPAKSRGAEDNENNLSEMLGKGEGDKDGQGEDDIDEDSNAHFYNKHNLIPPAGETSAWQLTWAICKLVDFLAAHKE